MRESGITLQRKALKAEDATNGYSPQQPRTSLSHAPKIVIFLPSVEGGGAERVFVQLANKFVALGCQVSLAMASARGPYLSEISEDVRLIDFASRGVLHSLPKLARYLRENRPDVILSGLDHANLVAILARVISRTGVRCVISMRSVFSAVYREDRSVRGWLERQLMRRAYRFADRIIANSRYVASDLSNFLHIPESKLYIVYNPLDIDSIEELSHAAVSHPWCAVEAPPMILGVGSLAGLKDFPTLIRAFSIVRAKRDCRLVILGEGADRAKLEDLVRQLEMECDVYLPGFVRNPFAWMRRAKLFVCSSLTEGCPNALMQALACGTPVVSTDCPGGTKEILEGGKWGRLCPIGDAEAMAEGIQASLDSSVQPDVRKRADSFALTGVAKEYLRVLLPERFPAVAGY